MSFGIKKASLFTQACFFIFNMDTILNLQSYDGVNEKIEVHIHGKVSGYNRRPINVPFLSLPLPSSLPPSLPPVLPFNGKPLQPHLPSSNIKVLFLFKCPLVPK